MPLGFPKPSWGKWEVRDMAIDDVHRIPSEAAGYCYSSRIIYADKENWLGDWVDLFDSNKKLWKSISYYNNAGDVPGYGHSGKGFGNPWKTVPGWQCTEGNRGDLERKLDNYQAYYNQHRCHTGLDGATPAERSGVRAQPIAKLESYTWRQHCNGLFRAQPTRTRESSSDWVSRGARLRPSCDIHRAAC
jgi:hypothetical protein